jgi:hypothetical protein
MQFGLRRIVVASGPGAVSAGPTTMSEQMESPTREQSESRNEKRLAVLQKDRHAICDRRIDLMAATEPAALHRAGQGRHAPQANVAQRTAKLHRDGRPGGFRIDDGRDGDCYIGAINPHSPCMLCNAPVEAQNRTRWPFARPHAKARCRAGRAASRLWLPGADREQTKPRNTCRGQSRKTWSRKRPLRQPAVMAKMAGICIVSANCIRTRVGHARS